MSKIVCNIEETVCTPSSNPTVTGAYIRCNIDDPSCIESTPTEGGGAAAPTYNLNGPSSINESESGIFTVATTGVDEGLLIPYTLTGVQSADVVGGSLTGTFEIDANGAGSVTIQMVEDFVAEGEIMVMTIGSALNPLDFVNVSIVDPTYTIVNTQGSTMVEGNSLNFEIQTTGISIGETRNWDITGSGHSLSATSGTITIQDIGPGLFIGDLVQISSVYDAAYQGTSNFTFRVFGSDGVTVVDTLAFTVTDAASTYSQSSASAFDEGTSLAVTVSTTNVQDATTLYWTVNHGTTATADFTAESGSFTITSNSGSFNVDAVADSTTEGSETFTIEIRTGSIAGPIVDTSSTITINDTSTTPVAITMYNEKYADFPTGGSLTNDLSSTSGITAQANTHYFTISMWFRVANFTGATNNIDAFMPVSIHDNNPISNPYNLIGGGFHAYYRNSSTLNFAGFSQSDGGSGVRGVLHSWDIATYPIADDEWHHLAFTWDPTAAQANSNTFGTYMTTTQLQQGLKMYLDGQPVSPATTFAQSVGFEVASSFDLLQFGSNAQSSAEQPFDLDEAAIWLSTSSSSVATASDILEIYNNGAPKSINNIGNLSTPTKHYRFEDSASVTYEDISQQNQGTLKSSSAYHPTVKSLTPMEDIYVTDWANQYVLDTDLNGYLDVAESLPLTSAWSVSFWVKTSYTGNGTQYFDAWYPFGSYNSTITTGNANQLNGILLQVRGSGNGYLQAANNGAYVAFSHNLFNNNWHNIVITWDGSYQSGNLSGTSFAAGARIYIDGVNVTGAPGTLTSTQQTWFTTSTNVRLGADLSGYNSYNAFQSGFTEQFAIWNGTALSQTEVTKIYNNGKPIDITNATTNELSSQPTRLYEYQDTANPTYDTISGTNHGTLSSWTPVSNYINSNIDMYYDNNNQKYLSGPPLYTIGGTYVETSGSKGLLNSGTGFDDLYTVYRTYNFWIYKPSSMSGEITWLGDFRNGTGGYCFFTNNSYDLCFYTNEFTTYRYWYLTSLTGFEDKWTMVTFTTDPGLIHSRFYLDGDTSNPIVPGTNVGQSGDFYPLQPTDTITQCGFLGARTYNTPNVIFPTSPGGMSTNTVSIDSFSAWDKKLSLSEIQELYNGGVPISDMSQHSASANCFRHIEFEGAEEKVICKIDDTFVLDKDPNVTSQRKFKY